MLTMMFDEELISCDEDEEEITVTEEDDELGPVMLDQYSFEFNDALIPCKELILLNYY